MPVIHFAQRAVRGLSFPITDLALLGAWAEAHYLQMKVLLDHGVDGEEYEEVLSFARQDGPVGSVSTRAGSVSTRASEHDPQLVTAAARSRGFQDGQHGHGAAEEL